MIGLAGNFSRAGELLTVQFPDTRTASHNCRPGSPIRGGFLPAAGPARPASVPYLLGSEARNHRARAELSSA
ncbi:hypothetical protein, partial [Mesorhizobium sp. M1A.F.Ca.IN.020.32.1.1]|uniref:hypothetical protein n=1 Tax=Mesorhizobium sp. M1A.F.Ca.IN.020.32.1.1 TaxID=2496763 RepID=UPI0019D47CF0